MYNVLAYTMPNSVDTYALVINDETNEYCGWNGKGLRPFTQDTREYVIPRTGTVIATVSFDTSEAALAELFARKAAHTAGVEAEARELIAQGIIDNASQLQPLVETGVIRDIVRNMVIHLTTSTIIG